MNRKKIAPLTILFSMYSISCLYGTENHQTIAPKHEETELIKFIENCSEDKTKIKEFVLALNLKKSSYNHQSGVFIMSLNENLRAAISYGNVQTSWVDLTIKKYNHQKKTTVTARAKIDDELLSDFNRSFDTKEYAIAVFVNRGTREKTLYFFNKQDGSQKFFTIK